MDTQRHPWALGDAPDAAKRTAHTFADAVTGTPGAIVDYVHSTATAAWSWATGVWHGEMRGVARQCLKAAFKTATIVWPVAGTGLLARSAITYGRAANAVEAALPGRVVDMNTHGRHGRSTTGPFRAAPGVQPSNMQFVTACPFECRWPDLLARLAGVIARTAEAPTWALDGDGMVSDAGAIDPLEVRL